MTRRSLKVDFFLPDLDIGGAQRTVVNLAGALALDPGLQVRLVTARSGPGARWLPQHLNVENLDAQRTISSIWALRRTLRRHRPDVLMATMAHANVAAWMATRFLPGRPSLVLRETNSHRSRTDLSDFLRRLVGWIYPRAEAVVALSEGVRRELVADYHIPAAQTHTIYNPVGVADFATQFGTPPRVGPLNQVRLVSVGRLTAQKNFPMLLRAMSMLPADRFHLTIVGDGEMRPALEAQIAETGLGDRVVLTGFVNDVAAALQAADVFVLTSAWEGFGHVIIEAMAAGLPVVATDAPHGPREILAGGKFGRLVPNHDEAALCTTLLELANDDELRARLSSAGRQRAADFDKTAIAATYRDLFLGLCGGNPATTNLDHA